MITFRLLWKLFNHMECLAEVIFFLSLISLATHWLISNMLLANLPSGIHLLLSHCKPFPLLSSRNITGYGSQASKFTIQPDLGSWTLRVVNAITWNSTESIWTPKDTVPYSSIRCIPVSHILPSFLNSLKYLVRIAWEVWSELCKIHQLSWNIQSKFRNISKIQENYICSTLNRPKWIGGGPGRVWIEEESCQPLPGFLSPKHMN